MTEVRTDNWISNTPLPMNHKHTYKHNANTYIHTLRHTHTHALKQTHTFKQTHAHTHAIMDLKS